MRRISLPRGDADVMPSRGEPLSAEQVQRIREWINQGARWPDRVTPATHWARQKPARRELTTAKGRLGDDIPGQTYSGSVLLD